MAGYYFLIMVGFGVLTTGIDGQNPSCPVSNPSANGCTCYPQGSGIRIECDDFYYADTPEEIKAALEFYKPYGPIVALYVYNIHQLWFSVVPEDFLAGNQIQNVYLSCYHSHSLNNGLLTLDVNAFRNDAGVCGLTGNVTFRDCNLRQFNSEVLTNCSMLEKLAFIDSYVESIIDIPTLESLKNFTVFSPSRWFNSTQQGLSEITLAPNSSLPGLRYLDLTGNNLNDDSITFVSNLTTIEELHLEGNNFTAVPFLTSAFLLHNFSMTLTSGAANGSVVLLPNPRTQVRSLTATLYSNLPAIHEINLLEGMFVQDTFNLKLNMTQFKEDVFLTPMASGLTINLNPAARFLCGCNISWLVRDNPHLLARVYNGTCADGRPFDAIPPEELSSC